MRAARCVPRRSNVAAERPTRGSGSWRRICLSRRLRPGFQGVHESQSRAADDNATQPRHGCGPVAPPGRRGPTGQEGVGGWRIRRAGFPGRAQRSGTERNGRTRRPSARRVSGRQYAPGSPRPGRRRWARHRRSSPQRLLQCRESQRQFRVAKVTDAAGTVRWGTLARRGARSARCDARLRGMRQKPCPRGCEQAPQPPADSAVHAPGAVSAAMSATRRLRSGRRASKLHGTRCAVQPTRGAPAHCRLAA